MRCTFLLCFFLIFSVLQSLGQSLDVRILRSIYLDRPKPLDIGMVRVSQSALPLGVGIPTLLLTTGLLNKQAPLQAKALNIGGGVGYALVLTIAAKAVINRDRPYETHPEINPIVHSESSSMPSGHTSTAFALATGLSLAYPNWYVVAPSFAWASAVGYSRLHLGVHYPSDVLAGALLGAGCAYLSHRCTKLLFPIPKKSPKTLGSY